MYISRQLSFASATQYQEIVDLTAQQTQMYDAACTFWAELFGCFQHALAVLNVKELNKRVTARNRGLAPEERAAGHPAGRVMTHYWGNPNPNLTLTRTRFLTLTLTLTRRTSHARACCSTPSSPRSWARATTAHTAS